MSAREGRKKHEGISGLGQAEGLHWKLSAELNAERASVPVDAADPPPSKPSRVDTRSTGEVVLLFEDWMEASVEDV